MVWPEYEFDDVEMVREEPGSTTQSLPELGHCCAVAGRIRADDESASTAVRMTAGLDKKGETIGNTLLFISLMITICEMRVPIASTRYRQRFG